MATASVSQGMLWTDLEGQTLPGGWRLIRLMRPEGRTAWFEATGPDGKPAMVSLTEALNDEEELLARLRVATAIRHPNVVAVHEARLIKAEETPMVLAAMEPTEENLADVLRERTLSAAEAKVVLESLLKGLTAIHEKRLTHGRMDAASVLAMGDTVKLRSDCLREENFEERIAQDVAGAGRIVTQAMTRRIPASEYDPALQLLPEGIGPAVRRALSGRATVEEVATLAGVRLSRPAVTRKQESANAAPAANPAPVSAKVTPMPAPRIKAETVQPEPVTPLDSGVRLGRRFDPEDDVDEKPVWSGWVKSDVWRRAWQRRWKYHRVDAPYWIGAALLLVLATVWVLTSWMGGSHAAKTPAAVNPKVVVKYATPGKAAVAPVTHGAPMAAQGSGRRVWRVVVETYGDRAHAAARAKALGAKYPSLRIGILAGHGGDYLVTVGGPLTREQAMAMRAKAVRMGLPRDAYAQNFR